MDIPLLVLRRRRRGSLPSAAYDARPRRGVPQPGRGFALRAAECAARKGTITRWKSKRRAPAHPSQLHLEPFAAGCRPGHPGSTRCPLLVAGSWSSCGLLIGRAGRCGAYRILPPMWWSWSSISPFQLRVSVF